MNELVLYSRSYEICTTLVIIILIAIIVIIIIIIIDVNIWGRLVGHQVMVDKQLTELLFHPLSKELIQSSW